VPATVGKMTAMVLADRSRREQQVADPPRARAEGPATGGGVDALPVRW
jgi:hypothetical protein